MPIDRFIRFAKECGADGIEVLDAFWYAPGKVRDRLPDPVYIEEFLTQAKTALAETGLRVHAVAVTNDFNHEDNARLRVERDKIRLGIQVAKELGAPAVRVFSGNPTSSDGVELVRYRTIDALKDLSESPIMLALENHGNIFATPSRLESILEPLDRHDVGVCFDIGNFLLADIDPVLAAGEMPAPCLVHVKDFQLAETGPYRSTKGIQYGGCRLGEGVVPIEATLAVLAEKLNGAPVFVDLEMECGDDGVEATRAGVTWLRNLLQS